MKGEDGMMEPLWIRGSILPTVTELTDSIDNTMDLDHVDSDESNNDAPCTDILYDQSDSDSDTTEMINKNRIKHKLRSMSSQLL